MEEDQNVSGVILNADLIHAFEDLILKLFVYEKRTREDLLPLDINKVLSIKKALKMLTPREEEVLFLRFGLDGKGAKTFREIAEKFKLSGERVRQIEQKALRKLRHTSRRDYALHLRDEKGQLLAYNVFFKDEVASIVTQQKRYIEMLEHDIAKLTAEKRSLKERLRIMHEFMINHDLKDPLPKQLSEDSTGYDIPSDFNRLIEEFELSARTATCLKRLGINTIGELAKKTERDLLKVKNFGRKSLSEVKELLAFHNMQLGMIKPSI